MSIETESKTRVVELITADKALLALRSSGHDYCSAVGEVVDNSLQANANFVRIKVFTTKKKIGSNTRATDVVERVAIGDDGEGMDEDTLHQCLQLGFSTRFNDRKGMGRFGVGAKMAGISQAKRIDVWSRRNVSESWLRTHIDLEAIEAGEMKIIPVPEECDPPEDCNHLVGNQGTLVLWSKTDNLEENDSGGGRRADTVSTEIVRYVARTFRRFLDSGITIEFDGKPIFPHDPLFLMTSTMHHQNSEPDPVAEIKVNETIDFPIPSDPTRTSPVLVTLTLLPKEFRVKRGKGGNDFAKARRYHDNAGISILRSDREIFNGILMNIQPSVEGKPIDRFIGKEIRFEPDLDECFHVRNVKKGAEPIEGMRDSLKRVIYNSIMTLRKEISAHFDKVDIERLQSDGIHADAEQVAAETQRTARKPKAGKDITPKERDAAIDEAAESLTKEVPSEHRDRKKAEAKAKLENNPISIIPDSWPGQEFIQIKHLGSNALVHLNMRHPFYTELYSKLIVVEQQDKDDHAKDIARLIRCGIDLLVIAYARAEGQYEDTSQFDSLRTNWGLELKDLIQHWLKRA